MHASHRFAALVSLVAAAWVGVACSAQAVTPVAAASASAAADLPRDVRDFVARRDQCDHFRGEDSADPKRQAQIDAKLKEFCTGTDKQLAALKKKYTANKPVLKTLGRFDAEIE